VTLSNIGTSVETNGTHSYGVFAQSVGGGGGDGGFAIAGTLSQGPSASFGLGGLPFATRVTPLAARLK
jgi:hypothetical protein